MCKEVGRRMDSKVNSKDLKTPNQQISIVQNSSQSFKVWMFENSSNAQKYHGLK